MKRIVLAAVILLAAVTTLTAATDRWVDTIVQQLPEWSTQPILTLTVWQWIGIGGAILLGLIIRKMVSLILRGTLRIARTRSASQWDDNIIEAFVGPTGTLAAVGVWFASVRILELGTEIAGITDKILQVIASIALIILFYRLTKVLLLFLRTLAEKTETDLDDQLMPVVEKTLKTLVIVFGGMIALQNLGVNVLSALAGLGIGGLAFALAARDTAANIFGSFTIFMDKPFKLGDWVRISGTHEGIVEDIGLRTTRLRTFKQTLISLPNSVVANTSMENISARPTRRVYTTVGVTYGTPAEKIERLVEEIRNIIRENAFAVEEGMQVSFVDYAASSLNIMIYFFVKVGSWTEELQAKQEVFLAVKKKAEEMGVEFAFPTQTIHVESMPGEVQ
jgi:MscS family membrane protein